MVTRSALALKLLTSREHGSIALAAMLTSAETHALAAAHHAPTLQPHEHRAAAAHPGQSPLHEAVLVALTAIGPVSFQVFLPALPVIRSSLGASPGAAQLALSLSMLGIAFATLAYGPLSDRLGRRPTLLAGMAVLLAGSLLSLAPRASPS